MKKHIAVRRVAKLPPADLSRSYFTKASALVLAALTLAFALCGCAPAAPAQVAVVTPQPSVEQEQPSAQQPPAEQFHAEQPPAEQTVAVTGNDAIDATKKLKESASARVGVLAGSIGERYADDNFPAAKIARYDAMNEAVAALKAESVDYVIITTSGAIAFAARDPQLEALPQPLVSGATGIAVNKNAPELTKRISEIIQKYIDDGTMQDIADHWLGGASMGYAGAEAQLPLAQAPVIASATSAEVATLRVAVCSTMEPMCFVHGGRITGADVELIKRIAYELGMRLELVDMSFSELIPSVQSGEVQTAISDIGITEERRQSVDFTTPYHDEPQVYLTRKKIAEQQTSRIDTLDDLADKSVGVITGTTYAEVARERWPEGEIAFFDTVPAMIEALLNRKVSAVLLDWPIAQTLVNSTSGLYILDEYLSSDRYGAIFAKTEGGIALRDQFNEFLSKRADVVDEVKKIWFGDDESLMVMEPVTSLPAINGTLRFASECTTPPFSYVKEGQVVGFEVDLVARFCKEYGYALEIYDVPLDSMITGVGLDKYDIAAVSITIDSERSESVCFSTPYYAGVTGVVVNEAEESVAAIAENARIGVLTDSVFEDVVREQYPDAMISGFEALPDAMTALESGMLDYVVLSEIDSTTYINSKRGFELFGNVLGSSAASIAVDRDNAALLKRMDELIASYKADGTLTEIYSNWIRPDGSDYVIADIPERESGQVLRVATCAAFEPTSFVLNGEYAGLDVELARRLAYDMGMQVEFVDVSFDALLQQLESGRADAVLAGLAETAERAQRVGFTQPYLEDPIVMVRFNPDISVAKVVSFGDELIASFDKNFVREHRWRLVLSGIGITMLISACSGVIGVLLGFGLCLLRRSRKPWVSRLTGAFVRVVQGTPIVVLLMIFYYIVFKKSGLDGVAVSIAAFGVNFAAYTAEILRTGIDAVDRTQWEAAEALGFGSAKTFTKIILPQASAHFMPVMRGEFISLVKATSVVGYVAVQDLTKVGDIIRSRTYEAFFPLIVTALIYFLLSWGLSLLLGLIEVRYDPKRRKNMLQGIVLAEDGKGDAK